MTRRRTVTPHTLGPAGVVLADRTHLRLFLIANGAIEEFAHETISDKRVRHVKATGTEHAQSSARIQRKADNQVRTNLREVVRKTEALVSAKHLPRFVLAGTAEITAALEALLPSNLRPLLAGHIDVGMKLTPPEVLEAVHPILEAREREAALESVDRLVTMAAKNSHAVVGLGSTLREINAGRVWEIVCAEGFHSPGFECPGCGAVYSRNAAECPQCQGLLERVTDIVAPAIERARSHKARIATVAGSTADALEAAGGIGAFLRTRPRTAAMP